MPIRPFTIVLGMSAAAAASHQVQAQCPSYAPAVNVGVIQSSQLVECSGMAASRKRHGVLWAHNDSGGLPRLYAMRRDGTHLGHYDLTGATNIDWEDMCIGPGPTPGVDYLYVGDIGDNANNRATIKVYRVPEPVVSQNQSPITVSLTNWELLTFEYEDGPRDAETLMADTNGDLYVVSKRVTALGRVYRAAFPQSTSSTNTLVFKASLPWGSTSGALGATGGDIAPDGSAVIVRRYTVLARYATLWVRPPGTNLWDAFAGSGCTITLPVDGQGEAVCFAPNSLSLYTTSEGSAQPIRYLARNLLPGDVTGDGMVDIDDYTQVVLYWGDCVDGELCPADLNNDTVVDINDFTAVILGWSP